MAASPTCQKKKRKPNVPAYSPCTTVSQADAESCFLSVQGWAPRESQPLCLLALWYCLAPPALPLSDGKVRFSSVQRLFCLNPEPDYWFSSAISLNPELNPWFRFKRVQFRFREGWTLNRTPNPFLGGAVEYYTFHSLILSSSDLRGWANSRDIIFVLYPFS